MSNFFFISFILLFILSCDKKEIQHIKSNSDSLFVYIEKGDNLNLPIKERLASNLLAEQIIDNSYIDTTSIKNYFFVAFNYFNQRDYVSYNRVMEKIKDNAINNKDSLNLGRYYFHKGEQQSELFQIDSAFYNLNKAGKIFARINNNNRLGRVFLQKAITQFSERDFFGAESSAIKALNYFKLDGETPYTTYELNKILGNICLVSGEYKEALDYFTKSKNIAQKEDILEIYQSKAAILYSLGQTYQKINKHETAIAVFNEALAEDKLFEENTLLYANLVEAKAYSNFKLNNNDNVFKGLNYALRIKDSLNNTTAVISSKQKLSEYYNKINKLDSAIFYAYEAYNLSKELNILNLQTETLKWVSEVDKKNQLKNTKLFLSLTDSLQNQERRVSEKFARLEYETDEVKAENEKLSIQNRNILIVFIIGIGFIGFAYMYRLQKMKEQRLLFIQQQQIANEEIYNLMLNQQKTTEQAVEEEKKRMAQDLHDGVLGRLFGIRLSLNTLNQSDTDEARKQRLKCIEELQEIEQDVREVSHELNREKAALINNFLKIVTNLLDTYDEKQFSVDRFFNPEINWDLLENNKKINLYRILQEAIQNINKYAQATVVEVIFDIKNNYLVMSIKDNGKGFDTTKKSKGIGMQNIISRVASMNGELKIESSQEKGTLVEVQIEIN